MAGYWTSVRAAKTPLNIVMVRLGSLLSLTKAEVGSIPLMTAAATSSRLHNICGAATSVMLERHFVRLPASRQQCSHFTATRFRRPSSSWTDGSLLRERSAGWNYLTEVRKLPRDTVERAAKAGVLREGIYGTLWALHRSKHDLPCGWEMRGPNYKGFSKGGTKTVFRLGDMRQAQRIVVTESFIDALSLGAIEDWSRTTVYLSTGGGFGPETASLLGTMIPQSARLVAATDHGTGGELLATRLHQVATTLGVGFSRLRPMSKDWNDQLKEGAAGG